MYLSLPLISASHYNDVIMSAMTSQIMIIYSTVYSGEDERKHQSSASLAFVRGINRWPVNFPPQGPVTQKMLPIEYVSMWHTSPHMSRLMAAFRPLRLVTCFLCETHRCFTSYYYHHTLIVVIFILFFHIDH